MRHFINAMIVYLSIILWSGLAVSYYAGITLYIPCHIEACIKIEQAMNVSPELASGVIFLIFAMYTCLIIILAVFINVEVLKIWKK